VVMMRLVPSSISAGRPRTLLMVTARPVRPRAAVTPRATIVDGLTRLRSWSSQILQRSISYVFGRLCSRRLPRISCLKCLTAFVMKMSSRVNPASRSARSSMRPAGPTNGLPLISSWSPGCSPTSITVAPLGPVPGTACVASRWSGQRVQAFSALARLRSDVIGCRRSSGTSISSVRVKIFRLFNPRVGHEFHRIPQKVAYDRQLGHCFDVGIVCVLAYSSLRKSEMHGRSRGGCASHAADHNGTRSFLYVLLDDEKGTRAIPLCPSELRCKSITWQLIEGYAGPAIRMSIFDPKAEDARAARRYPINRRYSAGIP
jgi:hypothetical protein